MRALRYLALLSLAVVPARSAAQVKVDTVDVTPALDTLGLRTSAVLTARVVDSLGRPKRTSITWTVRDSTAVHKRSPRPDSTGFYSIRLRTTGDTGRTYIVAQGGTKKDSALIIVRDTTCSETTLGSVNLYPDSSTAHRTDTLGTVATPRNTCGHLLGGVNLTWASSDSSKVTVTRLDSLVAKMIVLDSSGTVYIKAISGSKRDSVKVKPKHAP